MEQIKTSKINEGEKMVIFVDKAHLKKISFESFRKEEYIVKKETLYGVLHKNLTALQFQKYRN